ncbi:MAG: phosphohistidine phosphatase SixA [Nitrososphaerota archaeon]
MRIYLMRHGLAGNRDAWQGDDRLRPLTDKGERRIYAAADGLKALDLDVDALLTSPLVRARQTADIVGEALNLRVEEYEALAPGFGLEQLATLLTTYSTARGLMLFGHEPDFSHVIGQLIAPGGDAQILMKKGACCALDLPEIPDASVSREAAAAPEQHASRRLTGRATLLWLMTARQLARIAL